MNYKEIKDKCEVIRNTLISGSDVQLKSSIENIEWITNCADLADTRLEQKPKEVMVDSKGLINWACACGVILTSIQKVNFCSKCGRKIKWD